MAESWTNEIGGRVWMNSGKVTVQIEEMGEEGVEVEVEAGVVSMMGEEVGVIVAGAPEAVLKVLV
jgi:hypothetical protein